MRTALLFGLVVAIFFLSACAPVAKFQQDCQLEKVYYNNSADLCVHMKTEKWNQDFQQTMDNISQQQQQQLQHEQHMRELQMMQQPRTVYVPRPVYVPPVYLPIYPRYNYSEPYRGPTTTNCQRWGNSVQCTSY